MPEKIEAMTPALGILTGFLQSLTQKKKDMEAMALQKQKDQALAWRTMMPVIERERGETVRHMAKQAAQLEQFMAGLESKERIAGKEYELGLKDLNLKIKDLELKATVAGKKFEFDKWQTEYNADVQKALAGLELKLEEFKAGAGLMETMEEIAGRKAVSEAEIAGRKEVSEAEIKGRADISGKETAAAERMATEAKTSREDVTNWKITADKDLAELAKVGKLTDIEQSEVDIFNADVDRALRLQVNLASEPDNVMLATSLEIELDRLEAKRVGIINPLQSKAGLGLTPALPMVTPKEVRRLRKDIQAAIKARPALAPPEPSPGGPAKGTPAPITEQPATFNQYLAEATKALDQNDVNFLRDEGWSFEMISELGAAIKKRLAEK